MEKSDCPPPEDVAIELKKIDKVCGTDENQKEEEMEKMGSTKKEVEGKIIGEDEMMVEQNIEDRGILEEIPEIANVKQDEIKLEPNTDESGILDDIPEVTDVKQIEKMIKLQKITENIWSLEAESFRDVIDSLQISDIPIEEELNYADNEINFMGEPQNLLLLNEGENNRDYRENTEEWPFPVPIVLPIAPLNFHFDDDSLTDVMGLSPISELWKDSVSYENTPETVFNDPDLPPEDVSEDASTSDNDLKR